MVHTGVAKKAIAVVAAGATLFAGIVFAPTANAGTLTGFSDTPDWAWYAGAVQWVSRHHVMTGYNNRKFGPDNTLTRQEAAVLLWKKAGHPTVSNTEAESEIDNTFDDAGDIAVWGRQAFAWNVRNHVMTGVKTPSFDWDGNQIGTDLNADPDSPLTREMLATVLARDAHANTANENTTRMNRIRNAGRTSGWARPSMAWTVNRGILRGWPDARGLDPQGSVTRGQAATMIARYMGANPKGALAQKPKPKPKVMSQQHHSGKNPIPECDYSKYSDEQPVCRMTKMPPCHNGWCDIGTTTIHSYVPKGWHAG